MAKKIIDTGATGETLNSGFTKVNDNFTELYDDIIIYQGEWSSGNYQKNDLVKYNGSSYICILNTVGGALPSNVTYWEVLGGGSGLTEITEGEILGGTSSALRAITGRRLKYLYDLLVGAFPDPAKEEYILGTATYDATMTGTENLDLSLFVDQYGILTGNTTITVSNTPAAGKSFVRNLILKSTATETLTLPVGWIVIGTYVADGSENFLTIKFSNFPTVGLKVTCYIEQA